MKKILVVSAHPDDETLGCAGTLLKHEENNDEIYWVIFTEAHESVGFTPGFIENRERQIAFVADQYQFSKVFRLGYGTTTLHLVDIRDLISAFSKVISEVRPEVIYTVNRTDVHTDHKVVSNVVASCTKPFRYPFIKKVLMYECLSETEMSFQLVENMFIPNAFCDISNYIQKKEDILKIYDSEILEPPFPRSIENMRALARYRGSSVGVHFAEAFMLIRDIF